MARKNNSRRSQRNLIFKMNQQGFSVLQIEAKLSITAEHITYVLTQYNDDLKQRKADSPELQDRARIQAEVENRKLRFNEPANPPDRAIMKAELRKEILAELQADRPVVSIDTPSVPTYVPEAEQEDNTLSAEAPPAAEEPKAEAPEAKAPARPKRRKRKKA